MPFRENFPFAKIGSNNDTAIFLHRPIMSLRSHSVFSHMRLVTSPRLRTLSYDMRNFASGKRIPKAFVRLMPTHLSPLHLTKIAVH